MLTIRQILTCVVMATVVAGSSYISPLANGVTIPAQCGCGDATCGGCREGKMRAALDRLRPGRRDEVRFSPQTIDTGVSYADVGCADGSCGTPVDSMTAMLPWDETVPCDACEASPVIVACESCSSCDGECGCEAPARKSCFRRSRKATTTPCDCDHCELKVEQVEEKVKCFRTEQKEVCIPQVRLPWQRCCPPTRSKMRVVNTLTTDTKKVKVCDYKWSVHEPADEKGGATNQPAIEVPDLEPAVEAVDETASTVEGAIEEAVEPVSPAVDAARLKPVDLNDVPQPPLETE